MLLLLLLRVVHVVLRGVGRAAGVHAVRAVLLDAQLLCQRCSSSCPEQIYSRRVHRLADWPVKR